MGIAVGAVVTYHGSFTAEHGTTRVVADVDEAGRLVLHDRGYPDVHPLAQVRQTSVTPTGEMAVLCPHCRHETSWAGFRVDANRCGVYGCLCKQHEADTDGEHAGEATDDEEGR